MAALPETCTAHGECLVRRLGKCTNATVLDDNTKYFDDEHLSKFFADTGEAGFEKLVVN